MRQSFFLFILAIAALMCGCSNPASGGGADAGSAACTPTCDGRACGDDGCGNSCGDCPADQICDATGQCSACGNGVLDPHETCDDSADRRCPRESLCVQDDGCFVPTYQGSPETCDATCETTAITECIDADGCCHPDCHPGNDSDCVPETCGNGVVDIGENCDPPQHPCVTECEPEHSCQTATMIGVPESCTVVCQRTEITSCGLQADGCCAEGCTYETDPDCPAPVCGDGVVEGDERCDRGIAAPDAGACPADCDDNYACTSDLMSGEVADCSAQCSHSRTSACVAGDGCCPSGCTVEQDADCEQVVCGDGVVDGNEGCDNAIAQGESGFCPTDVAECDDADPCTTDELVGQPGDCSARCVNTPLPCADGDGCCPYTCAPDADTECAALNLCETYCFGAINYCRNDDQLYPDSDTCMVACAQMPVGRDGDDTGDSIHCRLHHLDEATNDAQTHCPHAAEEPSEGCVDFD